MENNNEQLNKQVYDDNHSDDYEEISEKRTSKLGYILLIIMAVFMIGIGQTIFSDLRSIPERPNSPAYCIANFKRTDSLNNLLYLQDCRFSEIDTMFTLDSQYNQLLPQLNQIVSLNTQISNNNHSVNLKNREITKLNKEYDLSLQEKMAEEPGIMDKNNIKSNITYKREKINNLKRQNTTLESQKNNLVSQIKPQINSLIASYDEAYEYYKDKNAWYKFKVFLLMLLFVLPFFGLSSYFYLKLKRKNSPYTIIVTAIMGASAVLFLQIVVMFLYDVLPKTWLTRIFQFFMDVPFLRYIIYYGSVILVIALFGGLVYFIQKKVFNPAKVAIRRLKDNKCPGCSFTLNNEHNYCPKCGLQIKEKCENCNNLKIRYLSHCPNCGK
jgi:uncharacterized membrane protein/predicted RNA-binding Zn-ribbon protein involved in translation (DUF1610 family)